MNKTRQRIDEINKKIAPLQLEVEKLQEEEQLNVQIPRLKKMIGYCLCSIHDKDKHTYARILDLIEDKNGTNWFLLENVSLQSGCNPYIYLNTEVPYTNKEWWNAEVPLYGWKKCSEEEYINFKESVLRELQTQKLIRKSTKNHDLKKGETNSCLPS